MSKVYEEITLALEKRDTKQHTELLKKVAALEMENSILEAENEKIRIEKEKLIAVIDNIKHANAISKRKECSRWI